MFRRPFDFKSLGRLKAGERNKTERAYEQYLEILLKNGLIAWYKFQPIKLKLAEKTTYTPDFFVMLPDGHLECHEVKGSKGIFMDDAKVKIKVAAEMYPFQFLVIFKEGSRWRPEKY